MKFWYLWPFKQTGPCLSYSMNLFKITFLSKMTRKSKMTIQKSKNCTSVVIFWPHWARWAKGCKGQHSLCAKSAFSAVLTKINWIQIVLAHVCVNTMWKIVLGRQKMIGIQYIWNSHLMFQPAYLCPHKTFYGKVRFRGGGNKWPTASLQLWASSGQLEIPGSLPP